MAEIYMERAPATPDSSNSVVTAIAIIVLAILVALFFISALPALRQQPADSGTGADIWLENPISDATPGTADTAAP